MEPWSPLEAALVSFHDRGEPAVVTVRTDFADPESLAAEVFFRPERAFEPWESMALARCGPRVLDVGAGVGCHVLVLQARGHRVTGLEILPEAVRIMRERGVRDARLGTIFEVGPGEVYDTVLLLMNGSMLAETLSGLDRLLTHARTLLGPGGALLLDSTDLRDPSGLGEDGRYVGELHYQLSMGDLRGDPFPQLFVDPDTLGERARAAGWSVDVVWSGDEGRYLAQLTPSVDAGPRGD